MEENKEMVTEVLNEPESIEVLPEETPALENKEAANQTIELNKTIEALEQKIHELEQKERLSARKQLLQQNGLSVGLAEFIQEDADMDKVIHILLDMKQSNSYIPRDRSTSDSTVISKEDFVKMSYTERLALVNKDRALYEQLSR